MASYIKVTRALDGNTRSGRITFTAKKGQLVVEDPATVATQGNVFTPPVSWKLANGEANPAHLERDVIQSPLPLDTFVFDKAFTTPDVMSKQADGSFEGYSSARTVQEVELEGPDLIDASITSGTAAGTEVSTKAGKISTVGAAGGDKAIYGTIVSQLVPVEEGNVRVLVSIARQ